MNTTRQCQQLASEPTGSALCTWMSLSARRVEAETIDHNEEREKRSSNFTDRGNKRVKKGLHFFSPQLTKSIVRLNVDEIIDQRMNLGDDIQEQHLHDSD